MNVRGRRKKAPSQAHRPRRQGQAGQAQEVEDSKPLRGHCDFPDRQACPRRTSSKTLSLFAGIVTTIRFQEVHDGAGVEDPKPLRRHCDMLPGPPSNHTLRSKILSLFAGMATSMSSSIEGTKPLRGHCNLRSHFSLCVTPCRRNQAHCAGIVTPHL